MKILLPMLIVLWSLSTSGQALSLDSMQQKARRNYPVLRQRQLTDRVTQLRLQNIRTGYLPQVELNGQATYQSDVTKVPIQLPGINIPELAKDQYKASVDVKQVIYDGGITAGQRNVQLAQQQAESQQVEVELHKLEMQVLQVYFNALLWEVHISAREQMVAEVKQRTERVQAGVDNGTVLASQADILHAEILKAEQDLTEARLGRRAALDVLSLLTGTDVEDSTQLQWPAAAATNGDDMLRRPELEWYRLQAGVLQQQSKLTGARDMPRISAFAQGGYGRPGLNMLDSRFDLYYIGGIRLNWTLWNWRYSRTEKAILEQQEQSLALQAETFSLQTRTELIRQSSTIQSLQAALEKDQEILALRTKVRLASAAQVDNGVITVHDYLTDLNAEVQAQIARRTHEIQFIYATLQYQVIKGY